MIAKFTILQKENQDFHAIILTLCLAKTVEISSESNVLSVDNWIVDHLVRSVHYRIGPFCVWSSSSDIGILIGYHFVYTHCHQNLHRYCFARD
jgi:hypothetical protein